MISINQTAESLHALIRVNNDRSELYNKARMQLDGSDEDLASLFEELAEESRFYAEDLHEIITLLGTEDGIKSTSLSGKINRVWMDIKNLIGGTDRQSLLTFCESCEDEAQKEYNAILENAGYMDENTRSQIAWQRDSLKISHDLIKEYRDRLSI